MAYRYEDNRNDRRLKAIDNVGVMKGGWAGGFGDRDRDDGKSAPQAEGIGSLLYARNHLGRVTDTLTPNGLWSVWRTGQEPGPGGVSR
ncbi:hypothetical protein V4890_24065 [Ralstonia solanacearum species complex bacterium KE056]|uniref:hypothetical protein n=1 Tax=Ralstonia solanacearum species complex bacterium KE056 TaxID=3119585 RepID=UPI002FC30518